jgi:hypothetical protein
MLFETHTHVFYRQKECSDSIEEAMKALPREGGPGLESLLAAAVITLTTALMCRRVLPVATPAPVPFNVSVVFSPSLSGVGLMLTSALTLSPDTGMICPHGKNPLNKLSR